MFFLVNSRTGDAIHKNNPIFSEMYEIGNFDLFVDKGWHRHNDVFYKGYCTENNLLAKIKSKNFANQQGSYCILDFSNQTLQIYFDSDRSFPLTFTDSFVSNLPNISGEHAYIDGSVIHRNKKFEWIPVAHKRFYAHPEINLDQAVDIVINSLLDYLQDFPHDNLYCGDTQGVDTAVIQSVLDYLGIPFTPGDRRFEHKAPNWAKNFGWGFKNNLYIDKASVITGYYGDEFVLRNPYFVNYILHTSGIDLNKVFDKHAGCYMSAFYNANYRTKISNSQQNENLQFNDLNEARQTLFNVMINDYQIWHCNTTLSVIPYRNFEMARILLHADCDTIIKQVTDAEINLNIIKKLSPKRLSKISKSKNIRG